MMMRAKLFLTLSFAITVLFCRAQSDSTHAAAAKSTTPTCCLNFLKSGPTFSSINLTSFGKSAWKPNYADELSLRLEYAPLITNNKYSPSINSNFNYHYDPANPFGSTSVSEGLIFGSIDYLLWKLFPEK
jgi:hypothetical protein